MLLNLHLYYYQHYSWHGFRPLLLHSFHQDTTKTVPFDDIEKKLLDHMSVN